MRDAAAQAGFNQSAFTRWKGGAKADPEFVVKFARAFNVNVLEALVEAEFITEDEAGFTEDKTPAKLRDAATHLERISIETAADAVRLNLLVTKLEDQLAEDHSPTIESHLYAVADSSPDEDELRAQRQGSVD